MSDYNCNTRMKIWWLLFQPTLHLGDVHPHALQDHHHGSLVDDSSFLVKPVKSLLQGVDLQWRDAMSTEVFVEIVVGNWFWTGLNNNKTCGNKRQFYMSRLRMVKNTNFFWDSKKLFLTYWKTVFWVTEHFCIKGTFWKNAFFCPKNAFFWPKWQFDPQTSED